jgi:hypothetical protein
MPKFRVSYSMDTCYEIDVEAENAYEASRIVRDGNANYDTAVLVGTEFASINDVEKIE